MIQSPTRCWTRYTDPCASWILFNFTLFAAFPVSVWLEGGKHESDKVEPCLNGDGEWKSIIQLIFFLWKYFFWEWYCEHFNYKDIRFHSFWLTIAVIFEVPWVLPINSYFLINFVIIRSTLHFLLTTCNSFSYLYETPVIFRNLQTTKFLSFSNYFISEIYPILPSTFP